MIRAVALLGGLALAASAGCAIAMRPVRFDARPAEWETLSGEWRGEYTIAGSDRRGSIMFRLIAAQHEAFGDVLMIPDRAGWPYRGSPTAGHGPDRPPRDETQLLTIRFVAADPGMVRGSMDPYWDPDRSCRAWASFIGSIDGDVIAGPFISVCEDGDRTLKGRWRVTRRPAAQPRGSR